MFIRFGVQSISSFSGVGLFVISFVGFAGVIGGLLVAFCCCNTCLERSSTLLLLLVAANVFASGFKCIGLTDLSELGRHFGEMDLPIDVGHTAFVGPPFVNSGISR